MGGCHGNCLVSMATTDITHISYGRRHTRNKKKLVQSAKKCLRNDLYLTHTKHISFYGLLQGKMAAKQPLLRKAFVYMLPKNKQELLLLYFAGSGYIEKKNREKKKVKK